LRYPTPQAAGMSGTSGVSSTLRRGRQRGPGEISANGAPTSAQPTARASSRRARRYFRICCATCLGCRLNRLDRAAQFISCQGYAGGGLHSQYESIRNFLRDDQSSARPFTQFFVDPPHVIEQLPQRLIPTFAYFEFDDEEPVVAINGQNVDPPVVNRELDTAMVSGLIETQSRFDAV